MRSANSFTLHVFLLALALRLIPVLLTRHLGIGLDDMFQYDMLARSLASGNGFRWYAPADLERIAPFLHLDVTQLSLDPRGMLTTFRAPLYPAFLSAIYAVSGINDGRFLAARLAQAVLGALLAPLTYLTAIRVLGPSPSPSGQEEHPGNPATHRPARLAAWAVAVYPILQIFPLALATENLFFPLVLAGVLVLLQIGRADSSRRAALYAVRAGWLLGLAALTRSVILPFAALALLWIWLVLRQPRSALVAACALAAAVAPWIARNSLLAHRLTGLETSMGYNLYVGYHPSSTGTFTFGPSLDLLSVLDDQQRDQLGTQQALAFIRQSPARFLYLALRRLGYFFNLELRAFTYFYVNNFLGFIPFPILLATLLFLGLPFVILALSAAGGWSLLPHRPESLLLLLLFVAYLVPHVVILSEERFHLVLIPFFAIPAALFWSQGLRSFSVRHPVLALLSVVIAVLLLANWGLELARDWHTLVRMLASGGNQLYLPY